MLHHCYSNHFGKRWPTRMGSLCVFKSIGNSIERTFPRSGFFKPTTNRNHIPIVKPPTDDLQSDRQAFGCLTSRNRRGRVAREVERVSQALANASFDRSAVNQLGAERSPVERIRNGKCPDRRC